MTSKSKTACRRLERFLEDEGIFDATVTVGRKHGTAKFEAYGKQMIYTFSASPSDHRVAKNQRADIRRMVRQAREAQNV